VTRGAAGGLALLVTVTLFWPAAALAAGGPGEAPALPVVSSGVRELAGRQEGEVWLGDQVVIRLRTAAGGFDPGDRASLVARRLAAFLAVGGDPHTVIVGPVSGEICVLAGDRLLATVDQATARLQDSDPVKLGTAWANQLRRKLGVGDLELVDGLPPGLAALEAEFGRASWYGPGFAGRPTASGEPFDPDAMTAAHRWLPFGTRVLVTELSGGRSVLVRINDRGPFVGGRIIDLARAAADALEMTRAGVVPVALRVLP